MSKNNVRPSLEGLYSIPESVSQGTGSGIAINDSADSPVRGSTPPGLQDFYRRKTQFYQFLPWAVGIFLALIVALYVVFLQSIFGPVNQLQVKTDENTTDINKLQTGLDNVKQALDKLPTGKQ